MSKEVERPWTDEQLKGDGVGKKELITFLQDHASRQFLSDHKLLGSLKNVTKTSNKDVLVAAYTELYEKKAFGGGDDDVIKDVTTKVKNLSCDQKHNKKEEKVEAGPVRFKKTNVIKKGDKVNFPTVGDKVKCYYVGKLEDGTVFDSLQAGTKKKKNQPLEFKVGKGNVIKGWDEALLTMSVGEKCEVVIEPEWAYGRYGKPEAKIPSNATLHFEIELVAIN